MYILIALLAAFIVYHLFSQPKESYENYDETTCLQLAKKNQENLDSLKKDVDALLALQTKVQSVENTTNTNSKQLSSLVDQVYKTPAV
jgi:Tfp pilus assembly protein PilN